jgi:hypothetical protein
MNFQNYLRVNFQNIVFINLWQKLKVNNKNYQENSLPTYCSYSAIFVKIQYVGTLCWSENTTPRYGLFI